MSDERDDVPVEDDADDTDGVDTDRAVPDGEEEPDGEATAEGPVTSRVEAMMEWSSRKPALAALGGVFLVLIGGVLFRWSTANVRDLFLVVLLTILSALIGAAGLLMIYEPIRDRVEADPITGLRRGLVVLVVGSVAAVVALLAGWSLGVIAAAVVVLIGLLALNAFLTTDRALALEVLGPGLALLLVGTLLAWTGNGLDGWSLGGLVAGVVGLILFKVGLPAWIDVVESRKVAALFGSLAATIVGVILLLVASGASSQLPLLGGIALVIIGLSALGIALLRFDRGATVGRVVLAVGLVALVVGWALLGGVLPLPPLVLLAWFLVAVLGAWFVFPGEALIAVLVVAFALAWVVVDRDAGEDRDPHPDAERTIVAFGDSFISGEGAPRYFDGTNVAGIGNNACRRAPTAYPWLVADRLDASLVFVACSGAQTINMDDDASPRPLPDPLGPIPGGEDQVQRLLASYADRVDDTSAVLVSIGGNDVYFGNIVQACLLPQTCAVDDRTGPWLANVASVEDTLVDTYTLLRDTFGADTPIVAIPYPLVVAPVEGCRIVIGDDEIAFVRQFTEALNDSIEQAATRAGINVYPGSEEAFVGRGWCDDDPATNSLHLSPTEGTFLDRVSPANWVHGSMHPRADGHALIAAGLVSDPDDGPVQGFLVDLLDSVEAGGPANPDPAGGPDVGSTGEPPEVPDRQWVQDRLYETVNDLVLPVGLILVGALLAAYGLVRARIPLLAGLVRLLEPADSRRSAPPEH